MKRFYALTAIFALAALFVFSSCETADTVQKKVVESTAPANDLYYHIDDIDTYLGNRYGEKIRRTEFDTSTEDMTFTIRDNVLQSIILGEWNTKYQFHGLKVGTKAFLATEKLKSDFTESSRSTKDLRVFTDRNNPEYILELDVDEDGTIYLIKYAHSSLNR